ncbi:hypothetical protein E2562_015093 [Oryza meyeriana var. granulata]|uniref:Uncharacterized protein n=1 Tax=Oryza meyeriana var. granulata TaxID=110450 RepID=A0A6G1DWQ4_9ORYZ|nr:hypothetical protein E2562_015093 [Oryza meyeriana var. granulata]
MDAPCGWSSAAAVAEEEDLRRGPWTVEEDVVLTGYVAAQGEGRWNELARAAGLRRTGKSCRLRWLNYLRPDVRRGDFTPQEQLLILELHFRWGNRWSKIAQHLPGRTDNEIKNYWRTRVQKHAKQLGCDVNSRQFKDVMRHLWMPRLVERIQAAAAADAAAATAPTSSSEHVAPPSAAHDQLVVVGRGDMCHSPDQSTMTSSTAGSSSTSTTSTSVPYGEQLPSSTNHHLLMTSVTAAAPDWSSDQCGSASAGISNDMFEGSWSELLARAYDDDGADSSLLPDFQMSKIGDNWWSLEDIWSQQPY